jgi:hypothetical protein
LTGEHTPLAVIGGGASLLGRAATSRGGVYFCSTTAAQADSSLGASGVVLYVLVHRALAAGAAVLGDTRQIAAGDPSVVSAERPQTWRQVAGPSDAISTDYAFHSGVYETGDKLFAVNSPPSEDQAGVLADQRVAALFAGLDFARVDDQAGSLAALINEIWRPFLATMILALIVEAILCMPKPAPPPVVTGPHARMNPVPA